MSQRSEFRGHLSHALDPIGEPRETGEQAHASHTTCRSPEQDVEKRIAVRILALEQVQGAVTQTEHHAEDHSPTGKIFDRPSLVCHWINPPEPCY